jgi:6-phosphogluconolactonase (cycloisomerase 2 family)
LALLASLAAAQTGCGSPVDGSASPPVTAEPASRGSSCDAIPAARGSELPPRFVYVANQNSHDISAFSVTGAGTLAAVGAPVSVGRYPEAIALHPNGRSLFVANHGSNTVSVLSVDPKRGALRRNGPDLLNMGSGPLAIVAHPDGRWVFVGNDDARAAASTNMVTTYQVDAATDRLVAVGAAETGSAGLLAMALDRSGRFLYTANALGDSVTVFHVDTCSGSLARVAQTEAPFPVALTASESGDFLYVASNGPAPAVRAFAIDPVTGALSAVASLTGSFAPWSLRAMRLDTSGQFLALVVRGGTPADDDSAFVSTLAIDPKTGVPGPARVSSVPAGANAVGVALGSGRFAYVSNFDSNDISSYAFDPARGIAASLGSVPAGSGPCALAIATGP